MRAPYGSQDGRYSATNNFGKHGASARDASVIAIPRFLKVKDRVVQASLALSNPAVESVVGKAQDGSDRPAVCPRVV